MSFVCFSFVYVFSPWIPAPAFLKVGFKPIIQINPFLSKNDFVKWSIIAKIESTLVSPHCLVILKKNGKLEESHFIGQVQPFSAIFDAARMRTKKWLFYLPLNSSLNNRLPSVYARVVGFRNHSHVTKRPGYSVSRGMLEDWF